MFGNTQQTVQTTPSSVVSIAERRARIMSLDISMVGRKLMEPSPEGKGWTQEQASLAELWYRRYLTLVLIAPPEIALVPNGPIDLFWHQHILDTRAYARDCQHIFGEFIHHFPYYGLNGDAAERDQSFDETNSLYREHFGEDCTTMSEVFDKSKVHDDTEVLFPPIESAQNCSTKDGGSPRCRSTKTMLGSSCNSAGSGTGCSQGGRGG